MIKNNRINVKRIMDNFRIIAWIITFGLLLLRTANCEIIFRVDPLALLSATLRTYQRAACDTDQIVLACPRGTSISIEFAQYNKFMEKDGISINELCPSENHTTLADRIRTKKRLLNGSTFGYPPNNDFDTNGANLNRNDGNISNNGTSDEILAPENCLWPNALQYSLLQTAVEACQKKKHCKFNAAPQFFGIGASGVGDSSGSSSYHSSSTASANIAGIDPCPKVRKIVEIAYKCRPYEFRSKVACENDVAQLECNPYSRIAVYSASFGRTEYESIQCPQPQGVREETCLASYATETVMKICHGRRRCNLAADANTFGSPCNRNSRLYLKVVYTCVPKQVLMDRYESDIEADEPEEFDGIINDLYDDQYYKESEAIPKLHSNVTQRGRGASGGSGSSGSGKVTGNNDNDIVSNGNGNTNNSNITNLLNSSESNSSSNPVMTYSTDGNLEDHQERLYFYLLIAGSIGVLLCILIVVVRAIIQKRQDNNAHLQSTTTSPKGETTIPNGFNDTISEIDADIDLTTAIPVPSVSKNENYITYGPTSNLYGSLGPSNVSHTSSTMLLPTTNSMMCGARQSPDIIGVANTYNMDIGLNDMTTVGSTSAGGMNLGPNSRMGGVAGGGVIGVHSGIGIPSSFGSFSSMGTIVPITSLGKYTTAPTFRTGYIMDHDGILRRPQSSMPPTSIPSGILTPPQIQAGQQLHLQQHQLPLVGGGGISVSGPSALPPQMQSDVYHYDGTPPRTLSTGVPINSQFYYG